MDLYSLLGRVRSGIKRRIMLTALDPVAAQVARGLSRVGPRIVSGPKTETELRLSGGHTLVLPAGLPSARRLHAHIYEPEVTKAVESTLHRGMTFVDIGANVGYYTLLASRRVGPTGKVFGFE